MRPDQERELISKNRPGGLWGDWIIFCIILSGIIGIRYLLYISAYYYGLTGLYRFYNGTQIAILIGSSLLICLFLLLFARLIWTVPQKKMRCFHVRLLLLILTCFAFYGGVKWPWCWSRREALHSGFLLRMQQKADVDAIRRWWETASDRYEVIDYIDKSDWPKAIKDLNPSYVEVGRKIALPKYVSLTWSSFGGNYWGLNVGPKTMQCPQSQKDRIEQEECVPLVDGAHVFFISFN